MHIYFNNQKTVNVLIAEQLQCHFHLISKRISLSKKTSQGHLTFSHKVDLMQVVLAVS